ncbi:Ig-like domain (group 2) [Lachnospiraceae bacterium XBB1006]|nr:Ig-like domain (group 2) [Lachnospiraceae bacterium XBB1006]
MRREKQIALALVCCLLLCNFLPHTGQAAASIRLSQTSATIKTGKTIKLSVKGTNKKVTWSSKNKTVATVSTKGVVKGIVPGKAKIVAKVAGKSYTCNVKVDVDEKAALKHLKVTYKESKDYTYAFITNENPYPLDISGKMKFYNEQKQYLNKASDYNNFVSAKSTVVLRFLHPMKDGSFYAPASHTDVELSVKKTVNHDGRKFLKATTELSADGKVLVTVTNTGKKKLNFVRYTLLMCDKDGNVLGDEQHHFTKMTGMEVCLLPGQSLDYEFVLRVDGKKVSIEKYELYLDYAIYD